MVNFDSQFWNKIKDESEFLYASPKPKRPTRISEFAKQGKILLQDFTKSNVRFVGEFPSRTSQRSRIMH